MAVVGYFATIHRCVCPMDFQVHAEMEQSNRTVGHCRIPTGGMRTPKIVTSQTIIDRVDLRRSSSVTNIGMS